MEKAFFEQVAEQLIEQLKQGTSPLQRVWEPGMGTMPINPTTGKRYRGGNALWLSMQGRGDPRWLTYKQAQAEGAQVRRGEKSTTIEYWKFREEQVKKGEDGKPILDANGNKVMVSIELERPKVFYAKVFNAEQIDGMPPLERKEQAWDAVERAERIVAASGARIIHEPGDRAFYRPSTDTITLPEKGQFPTAANYHAIQMHELGHWTGHPSRLDRDLSHPFGSEGYAREELRAEIASMMLGMELGLGRDPGQHAAYVGSWIQVLEEDPRELFRAAADAEKIHNFVLTFEQQQVQEQATEEQSQLAPVPEAWRYEACRVFDEEMAISSGIPDYSRARQLAHALNEYEEMTFEPSAREQAILEEKKPAMDEAAQWIRENVLLNPVVKERVYETVRDAGQYTGDAVADKERHDYLAEMAGLMAQKAAKLQAEQGPEATAEAQADYDQQAAKVIQGFAEQLQVINAMPEGLQRDSLADRVARKHVAALAGEFVGTKHEGPMIEVVAAGMDSNARYRATIEEELPGDLEPLVEQKEVHLHLANESAHAIAGYRSIESWENLESAAEEHGLRAVLRWSSLGNPASLLHTQEGPSDVYIQYLDAAGRELPIHSELNSGDGKAITCLDGRRVSGTGFTSDEEWQRASLASAVATLQARENQAAKVEKVEHAAPTVDPEKLKAERWILERLGKELNPAVARMSQSQADTTYGILDDMHPLGNDNPFWLRHPEAMERMFNDPDAVEAAIFSAQDAVRERWDILREQAVPSAETIGLSDKDQDLVGALHKLRTYRGSGDFDAAAMFWEESDIALDSQLPEDWTGAVRVGSNETGGFSVLAERAGGEPSLMGDFDTEDSAHERADEYRMIDAYAQLDPLQKDLKLALARETVVTRSSASSADEIAAAKEARKSAEIALTLNSNDLRERIDALEEQAAASSVLGNVAAQNTWLAVPYEEREQAKKAAGKLPSGKPAIDFDSNTKCWYARPGADLDKLREWLPQNRPVQQRAESPEDELAAAMKEMGMVVEGGHPIIDGEWHRVPVQGDSKGTTSGTYKAYPVKHGEKGVPAGVLQNFRTGARTNWKAKGYVLSDSDRAQMHAESAVHRSARDAEREATQRRAEKAINELLAVAAPAPADATYLSNKNARADGLKAVPADGSGLPADSIILIGKTAQESKALREENPDNLVFTAGDLLLTAQDMSDTIKSVQSIRPNGTKMFAKGTEKHGHFHVTGDGGVKSLEAAPVIVVSEGYATADTVSQILGYPTVASFDSGNLPSIGRQIRERFPDKPILFAGDNDLHVVLIHGTNPGREKAELAAEEVGGVAIFPVFAPGEQEYPADVEPIDREKAKANELTQSQKDALSAMKKLTDFNDLALRSKLGKEGVERQLRSGVAMAIKTQQDRSQRLGQEQTLQQQRVDTVGVETPSKRRAMKM
ncbi:zincin-like metallopeptidase domain-containing protein [Pseudomonas sp. PDM20]|uniref:zincin-like metallopeptidase domain-containing protein n=1 Tax=Pseudomonas sp. PDM20 TaxID=2769254 RepID=UPI00177B3146|nr:zincin-like metallopeptidase domain-containing protein [Pseudomonas sp. PDM20]MBD9686834.1 DUF1738 domain-containing protein [Pseudomonas sp. PDM20]